MAIVVSKEGVADRPSWLPKKDFTEIRVRLDKTGFLIFGVQIRGELFAPAAECIGHGGDPHAFDLCEVRAVVIADVAASEQRHVDGFVGGRRAEQWTRQDVGHGDGRAGTTDGDARADACPF